MEDNELINIKLKSIENNTTILYRLLFSFGILVIFLLNTGKNLTLIQEAVPYIMWVLFYANILIFK